MGNPQSPPFAYSWLPAALIRPEEKPAAVSVSKAGMFFSGKPEAATGPAGCGGSASSQEPPETQPRKVPPYPGSGPGRKTLSLSVLLGLVPP